MPSCDVLFFICNCCSSSIKQFHEFYDAFNNRRLESRKLDYSKSEDMVNSRAQNLCFSTCTASPVDLSTFKPLNVSNLTKKETRSKRLRFWTSISAPLYLRSHPVYKTFGSVLELIENMTTDLCIREVWNDNLEQEFDLIREIIHDYPYIAMDTHYPGEVVRPKGPISNYSDYNYASVQGNIDFLKLIQLGLTFSDEDGNMPMFGTGNPCVWQFNFREFDVSEDVYATDSIEMLRQRGIDFKKNVEKGVDAHRFGELLCSSGAVLDDNIHWVTFHGRYDFGYLLKLLTRKGLPDSQSDFFQLINLYFPNFYDVKFMMKFCNVLDCGLNKLAEILDVERQGGSHQAGSDSLLTSNVFRKMKDFYFNGNTEKYAGVLYGLGVAKGEK